MRLGTARRMIAINSNANEPLTLFSRMIAPMFSSSQGHCGVTSFQGIGLRLRIYDQIVNGQEEGAMQDFGCVQCI